MKIETKKQLSQAKVELAIAIATKAANLHMAVCVYSAIVEASQRLNVDINKGEAAAFVEALESQIEEDERIIEHSREHLIEIRKAAGLIEGPKKGKASAEEFMDGIMRKKDE